MLRFRIWKVGILHLAAGVLAVFLLCPSAVRAQDDAPERIVNSIGMEFVRIEPGTFVMGSPEDEPLRSESEILHEAVVEEPFYMQTTPVTLSQWQKVMGKRWLFRRRGDPDAPIVRVSWHDAASFAKRLGSREEGIYRLPTETEWEYAARAGTQTPYPWGKQIDCSRALYANNPKRVDDCVEYVESGGLEPGGPAPVGSYDPNPWGLYDMHGNVWEWTQDCFRRYTEPPAQVYECTRRVRRGGSWFGHGYQVRSANRAYAHPAAKFRTTGFRVVKEAP